VGNIDEVVMGLLIVGGGLKTDAVGREGRLAVMGAWSVAAGVDIMAGTGRTEDVLIGDRLVEDGVWLESKVLAVEAMTAVTSLVFRRGAIAVVDDGVWLESKVLAVEAMTAVTSLVLRRGVIAGIEVGTGMINEDADTVGRGDKSNYGMDWRGSWTGDDGSDRWIDIGDGIMSISDSLIAWNTMSLLFCTLATNRSSIPSNCAISI